MGRKPRSSSSSSDSSCRAGGCLYSLYVLAGSVGPSIVWLAIVACFSHSAYVNAPLRASSDTGETSRLKSLGGNSRRELFLSGGDLTPGVLDCDSNGGVSVSGENALEGTAPGGREGSAFSLTDIEPLAPPLAPVFVLFRLRAIKASWQLIQKMPCDVRAYLRFSIFFLQFRHLKQALQKAWSPVRIAKSSILFPQALQL
jgi:hypothetical protein